jgi:hypothetical protein
MPELLKELPPSRRQYHFERYADGKPRRFHKGVDFDTGLDRFRRAAASWGHRNGCRVESRSDPRSASLILRITPE